MNMRAEDTLRLGAIVAMAIALAGCGGQLDEDMEDKAGSGTDAAVQEHARMFQGVEAAVAVLTPTEDNEVQGSVVFREVDAGVEVTAIVRGLEPGSSHGFHIHQWGDITEADGSGAGGHYDPEGHEHGLPPGRPRHAGDLGNLESDADGVARYERTVSNITVAGLDNPIIGRAVIVHADADDGGQPTGNAGPRLAQGVIGIASPEMLARAE